MDVDATVSIEASDQGPSWGRTVALLVFGVGLGFALAHFAPRFRAGAADGPELRDLTRDELYERAQAAGIPGRSGMSKDQLIDALEIGP